MKKEYCNCKSDDCTGNCELQVGFIAEELNECGLSDFVVNREDENGEMVTYGVKYEKICVPMLEIMKKHEARIKELETALQLLKL